MSDAEGRRTRSEEVLKALGIAVNPHLPWIESEEEARLRTPAEAARRMLVLLCVSAVANGIDRDTIVAWMHAEGLWPLASGRELRFLESESPSDRERMDATWNVECAWLLAWALRLREDLGFPEQECKPWDLLEQIPDLGAPTRTFVEGASLRTKAEILDASDLIYRCHWAARDAQLRGEESAGPIDIEVAMEWHKAVNWLTCYDDEDDWDMVTTDT